MAVLDNCLEVPAGHRVAFLGLKQPCRSLEWALGAGCRYAGGSRCGLRGCVAGLLGRAGLGSSGLVRVVFQVFGHIGLSDNRRA